MRCGRWAVILWTLLLLLLLTACVSGSVQVRDIEIDGVVYTVDQEKGTITYGDVTIRFSSSVDKIRFTYPDGSTYWWAQENGMGYGGWDNGYDAERYVPGDILVDIVNRAWSDRGGGDHSGGGILAGLLLILFGALGAAVPRAVWYLDCGWRYKDAEPSDLALLVHRFGGVVMVVLGLILLLV